MAEKKEGNIQNILTGDDVLNGNWAAVIASLQVEETRIAIPPLSMLLPNEDGAGEIEEGVIRIGIQNISDETQTVNLFGANINSLAPNFGNNENIVIRGFGEKYSKILCEQTMVGKQPCYGLRVFANSNQQATQTIYITDKNSYGGSTTLPIFMAEYLTPTQYTDDIIDCPFLEFGIDGNTELKTTMLPKSELILAIWRYKRQEDTATLIQPTTTAIDPTFTFTFYVKNEEVQKAREQKLAARAEKRAARVQQIKGKNYGKGTK